MKRILNGVLLEMEDIEIQHMEYIDAINKQKELEVLPQKNRETRNRLLAETDWVVVSCTEKGTNIPLQWEVYRQALRDITDHVNFPHLEEADWPTKP